MSITIVENGMGQYLVELEAQGTATATALRPYFHTDLATIPFR